MTNQEINHRIATEVKGWKPLGDGWYDDGSGFYNPLPDFCQSISHALDLAKASDIAMRPTVDGWEAASVDNPDVVMSDAVLATAIAMTALAIENSKQQV